MGVIGSMGGMSPDAQYRQDSDFNRDTAAGGGAGRVQGCVERDAQPWPAAIERAAAGGGDGERGCVGADGGRAAGRWAGGSAAWRDGDRSAGGGGVRSAGVCPCAGVDSARMGGDAGDRRAGQESAFCADGLRGAAGERGGGVQELGEAAGGRRRRGAQVGDCSGDGSCEGDGGADGGTDRLAGAGRARRAAAPAAVDGDVCGAAAGDSSFSGCERAIEPVADDAAAVAVWVRLRAVQLAGGGAGKEWGGLPACLAADTDDAGRGCPGLGAVAKVFSARVAGAEAEAGGEGEGGAEVVGQPDGAGGGDSGAGAEGGTGEDGGDDCADGGEAGDAAVALSQTGGGAASGAARGVQRDLVFAGVRGERG